MINHIWCHCFFILFFLTLFCVFSVSPLSLSTSFSLHCVLSLLSLFLSLSHLHYLACTCTSRELCDRGWCPFICMYTSNNFFLLVNEKRRCWLNVSLKSTETRDELSTTCNLKSKLCQDACQHLMLHPYITASRTIVIIYYLKLYSGIGH